MESPQEAHYKNAEKNAKLWVRIASQCINYLMFDLFGGPKVIKARVVLDFQVLAFILFILFCVNQFGLNSPSSIVMCALSLIHEIWWLMKDQIFPDRSWENKMTAFGVIGFLVYLVSLWTIPFFLFAGLSKPVYPIPENAWLVLSIVIFGVGLILMVGADVHKNLFLAERQGLITNGLFRYVRHPNYLGQILMYVSMLMIVWHWVPTFAFLVFLFIAIVNIQMKEASMQRYPGWREYCKKTKLIIPWIL